MSMVHTSLTAQSFVENAVLFVQFYDASSKVALQSLGWLASHLSLSLPLRPCPALHGPFGAQRWAICLWSGPLVLASVGSRLGPVAKRLWHTLPVRSCSFSNSRLLGFVRPWGRWLSVDTRYEGPDFSQYIPMIQEDTFRFTFGVNKISILAVRDGPVKAVYLYHFVFVLVVVWSMFFRTIPHHPAGHQGLARP